MNIRTRLRRVVQALKVLRVLAKRRGSGAYKVLYHIGPRPASPKPYHKLHEAWRYKGEEIVYMSPAWKGIWNNHGVRGNVYKYKIPVAAIKAAGGIKRYDSGSEVVFTRDVWEDYSLGHAEFSKILDRKAAEREMNKGVEQYFRDVPLGAEQSKSIVEDAKKRYKKRYFKTKEDESNPYKVDKYNKAIKEVEEYLNEYPYRPGQ